MAKTVAGREGSNQCWISVMGSERDRHPRNRRLSYEPPDSRSKQGLAKQETYYYYYYYYTNYIIHTVSLVTVASYVLITRHTA